VADGYQFPKNAKNYFRTTKRTLSVCGSIAASVYQLSHVIKQRVGGNECRYTESCYTNISLYREESVAAESKYFERQFMRTDKRACLKLSFELGVIEAIEVWDV